MADTVTSQIIANTPGYHLTEDLADHAIGWLKKHQSYTPDDPSTAAGGPSDSRARTAVPIGREPTSPVVARPRRVNPADTTVHRSVRQMIQPDRYVGPPNDQCLDPGGFVTLL